MPYPRRSFLRQGCLFALLGLSAVSGAFARPAHLARWTGTIRPPVAVDLDPDPDVVEVELVASVGQVRFVRGGPRSAVWTYNGSLPGPMIEAEVGNTLIVHFVNELPEPTTIHWHGLELPAEMDGSHIAQHPVPPGGTFRYEFKLLRAATYWYHPHVRSNVQVEKGLYGALVVRDPEEDAALGLPPREHVLVLDDVLLDGDGQVAEPFPGDPLAKAAVSVNGREGNVLLVNGRAGRTATLRRGVPHRLRFVNTSSSRFMRVSLSGHSMWRIGGDLGLLEEPIEIAPVDLVPDPDAPGALISDPDPATGLLLTPAERADVVFVPTGGEVRVEWHDVPRGRQSASYRGDGSIALAITGDDGKRPPVTLLTLRLIGAPRDRPYAPPAALRDIVPIDVTGAAAIPVDFGHTPPDTAGNVTFFAQLKNNAPLPFAEVTPDDAPVVAVGETRVWEVRNLSAGAHNFHSHGFGFQALETEYVDLDAPENNYVVPAPYLEDKDTILLPGRTGVRGRSYTITRLAARFDDAGREGRIVAFGKEPGDGTSGGWLFHCHLLEHADGGMMSFLQVVADGD